MMMRCLSCEGPGADRYRHAEDRNPSAFDACAWALSVLADRHDLKASVGQSFNDTFRDLLGFLRIHPMVWVIISGIANRRGDYRIHLVLISHRRSPDQTTLSSGRTSQLTVARRRKARKC
jgi:hypothetical protein